MSHPLPSPTTAPIPPPLTRRQHQLLSRRSQQSYESFMGNPPRGWKKWWRNTDDVAWVMYQDQAGARTSVIEPGVKHLTSIYLPWGVQHLVVGRLTRRIMGQYAHQGEFNWREHPNPVPDPHTATTYWGLRKDIVGCPHIRECIRANLLLNLEVEWRGVEAVS